jgi:hypothetical protein
VRLSDQLEVEVSCILEDRLRSGLPGDHGEQPHLTRVRSLVSMEAVAQGLCGLPMLGWCGRSSA